MNEEQQKELEDYWSGNSVRPPHGSVFDGMDLKGGPPMMRLIILQMAFAFISSIKEVRPKFKAAMIGLVCAFFFYTDMKSFMDQRHPNLYNIVGFDRNSDAAFIDERLNLARICDTELTEEACSMFSFTDKRRLNATEIE